MDNTEPTTTATATTTSSTTTTQSLQNTHPHTGNLLRPILPRHGIHGGNVHTASPTRDDTPGIRDAVIMGLSVEITFILTMDKNIDIPSPCPVHTYEKTLDQLFLTSKDGNYTTKYAREKRQLVVQQFIKKYPFPHDKLRRMRELFLQNDQYWQQLEQAQNYRFATLSRIAKFYANAIQGKPRNEKRDIQNDVYFRWARNVWVEFKRQSDKTMARASYCALVTEIRDSNEMPNSAEDITQTVRIIFQDETLYY